MDRTLIALFDNQSDAMGARADLIAAGFPANQINMSEQNEPEESGFMAGLRRFFVGPDRDIYEEAARRGGTLLSLTADEAKMDQAVDIMSHYNPVDIERRAEEWRQAGWSETALREGEHKTGREEHIPVVEERLDIGKQRESRGGVRIYSHVTEQPVEEDVRLREEHVEVERRKADRPASKQDLRDQTIEMTEMHEEPVVRKEARVVEEVVLHKTETERTETVRDTVKRTDVDVDKLDKEYRSDFEQRYAGRGYSYDQVQAAYRYGEQLGSDPQYRNYSWKEVEPEARVIFEDRNPGMWDEVKDAVRSAFERVQHRKAA